MHRLRAWLRVLSVVAAVAAGFLVWDELDRTVLARPLVLLVAFALSIIGVTGGAMSWAALMDRSERGRALDAFASSQPSKYLPGGAIVQVGTQVGLSMSPGGLKNTSKLAVSHAALQLLTGLVFGAATIVVFLPEPAEVSVAPLLAVAGMSTFWLGPKSIDVARAALPERFPLTELPKARARTSVAFTLLTLTTAGLSFGVVAGESLTTAPLVVLPVFSLAWAAGFLALPLPSGAVVREAVLFLALDIELPDLIAVSLAHRTIIIGAEFALMLVIATRQAWLRRAAASDPPT